MRQAYPLSQERGWRTYGCANITKMRDTDMFDWNIVPDKLWEECDGAGVAIFHRALPALLSSRFPVVIDHVLVEAKWHQECCEALQGHKVLWVGIHCSLDILRSRERARGDRGVGLAERQYAQVHRHRAYDIDLDTSSVSPEECAQRILAAFAVYGEQEA